MQKNEIGQTELSKKEVNAVMRIRILIKEEGGEEGAAESITPQLEVDVDEPEFT